MNKKWIVPILGIILAVSIIMNVKQYRENTAYTHYVSGELANKVSPLSSAILENVEVFSEINEQGTITLLQAEMINSNFNNILINYQDIEFLARDLNRFDLAVTTTKQFMSRNTLFGNSMLDSLEGKENRELLDSEKKVIENYLHLMKNYESVVKAHVPGATSQGMTDEYWDAFIKDGVKKDYWINLIEGITRETVNVY